MMTSQILESVDFTKAQKSSYLDNKTFLFQIKNSLIAHQGLLYGKNTFVVEVTFQLSNDINRKNCSFKKACRNTEFYP